MKLLVILSAVALASASLLPTYGLPHPDVHTGYHGTHRPVHSCGYGQVFHAGRCVNPIVNRRVYLYDVPPIPPKVNHRPVYVPDPVVEQNVLFVKLPEGIQGPDPIVVGPPQQKQVVYVLNKQSEHDQRVIQVPAPPPTNPEVYFVNYEDGENPTLPDGVDLHTAINSAARGGGRVIGQGGLHGGGLVIGQGGHHGGLFGQGGVISPGGLHGGHVDGHGVSVSVTTPSGLYTAP